MNRPHRREDTVTRLFVVEDHALMRENLKALLGRESDFVVCGEAASGEEALTRLPAGADMVLIDVSMPGMDGLELLQEIQARWPQLACVILSGHAEAVYGAAAREGGALAYLDKRQVRQIVPAIRQVLASLPDARG